MRDIHMDIFFGGVLFLRPGNVLAQLPATPGCSVAPPLYIGTPINSFFGAAGERGAGIALLLALAKGLAEPCGCRSWQPIFGFTSGHEQFLILKDLKAEMV